MNEPILIVDDEPNVLDGYRRHLGGKYAVSFAKSGAEGLAEIERQGAFAVVVTDMNMEGMNGVEFLKRVQQKSPDAIRLMLTGGNLENAVAAVNEVQIFRYLTKPCPVEILREAIEAALAQYRVVAAERTVLSTTLIGAIKILVDTLSSIRPVAFGRATRVRTTVRRIAEAMIPGQVWQADVASMLSQVGCVFLPDETLEKAYSGQYLTIPEENAYLSHPARGSALVANVPRLKEVADIIANQEKGYDGSGLPDNGLRGESLPIESRILKVALDYDSLLCAGSNSAEALQTLYARGSRYDRKVIDALCKSLAVEAARNVLAVASA